MRVVVAMSGGVDSSAASALMLEAGHDVLGITLRVWSYGDAARCGSCCSPEDIDDARGVADALGIPFYVADAEELFRERVVQPFVDGYLQGRTPIPCVACNEDVKFGFMLRRARSLGAKLATGHYARIADDGGRLRLLRAKDPAKDQSYFLFKLGQDALRDVLFPVGDLSKAEVRAVAERRGLRVSHKPESMEICFVPDGDYAGFVERLAGPQPAGELVNEAGETLGRHAGIHRFTIGQRRGLGLSAPAPLYVERIDAARHQVVVGPAAALARERFTVLRPAWVDACPEPDETVQVRIRHRHAGAAARVAPLDAGRVSVELLEPVRAVTPGQAAVFYRGAEVLGGGFIG